jgi:hypothetical protein
MTTLIAGGGSVNYFMQLNAQTAQSHEFRNGAGDCLPATNNVSPGFAIVRKN